MAEEEKTGELNMTSMIDVVFLLLIFFMLNLNFPVKERTLQAVVPQSVAGGGAASDLSIVLNIENKGIPGGRPVIEISLQGTNLKDDFRKLSSDLTKWMKDLGNTDVPVVIQTGKTVPYWAFVQALNATREAGVKNIKFAAQAG